MSLLAGRYTVSVSPIGTSPEKMVVRPVCQPNVEDIKKQFIAESTKVVTTEIAELDADDDHPIVTPMNFPKRFQIEMAMDHKVSMHMI